MTAKEHAVQFARSGGIARDKALSKERKQEIARIAIKVRWDKYRAGLPEKAKQTPGDG
mgnify:CR=1 FL=1